MKSLKNFANLFRIPVHITPLFWMTAPFIVHYVLIIVRYKAFDCTLYGYFCVFLGGILVLVAYEFGSAFVARCFGYKARIVLYPWGGETLYDEDSAQVWKELLIKLSAPVFSYTFLNIFYFFFCSRYFNMGWFNTVYDVVDLLRRWVSVNFIPIIPMNGGYILLILAKFIFRSKGVKCIIVMNIVLTVAATIYSYIMVPFLPIIFIVCVFKSCFIWKKKRAITNKDCQISVIKDFLKIRALIQKKEIKIAISRLETFCSTVQGGLLYNRAAQSLAYFKIMEGEFAMVYRILKPIKRDLTPEAQICLFHAAYEMADYSLVLQLSAPCFQVDADSNIALRSAEACAVLNRYKSAIGWLIATYRSGCANLRSILSRKIFDPLRNMSEFIKLYDVCDDNAKSMQILD